MQKLVRACLVLVPVLLVSVLVPMLLVLVLPRQK
jgi:hypothetical protein